MNSKEFNACLRQLKTNEAAFRRIYEYFLPKIKYRISIKFGNSVDFEDAAHELFTKLIRMKDPPWVDSPNAWVYKICDNICLDILKEKVPSLPLDERIAVSEEKAISLGNISQAESELDFFSALALLESDDEEIVRQVLWEGFTLKEVAENLNMGYSAVRQKYSRALKKLKIKLKNYND